MTPTGPLAASGLSPPGLSVPPPPPLALPGLPTPASNPLIVFGAAAVALVVVGRIARRLGGSVIPAYVLLGVALGPHGLGFGRAALDVPAVELLELPASLGVVLLLFFVGLELRLETLAAERERFARAGAVDVATAAPLGFAVGLAAGVGTLGAAFVALIAFNSSTVVVARSLTDLGWRGTPESDAILGIVVIEDVLTAAAFGALSAALVAGGDPLAVAVAVVVGFAVLAGVAALALAGDATLGRIGVGLDDESFVLLTLGLAALTAGIGTLGGTSDAVAAFLAGTAFRRAGLVDRVERLLGPLRDLFAALFFLYVGAVVDLDAVIRVADLVVLAGAVTVAGQVAGGYLAGRAYGLGPAASTRVGTALSPRGEFSLVIAAFLATAGTTPALRTTIPAFTVGYVLLTSVLGTVLMRRADAIEAFRARAVAPLR